MNRACLEYRNEWLRERARRPHTASCSACAGWTLSTAQQIAALSALSHMSAPASLDGRIDRELGGARTERLERVLGSLVRHGSPAVLDALVIDELARGALVQESAADDASDAAAEGVADGMERGERNAQVLRALDVQSAPHVLERLVDEELRAPAAALAERFSGNLERLSAPAALERRLQARARRRALLRLVAAPLLTATAAGVVVWFVARGGREERPPYSFEVVEAKSLTDLDQVDLDPMALQLASILGGGAADIGGPR